LAVEQFIGTACQDQATGKLWQVELHTKASTRSHQQLKYAWCWLFSFCKAAPTL